MKLVASFVSTHTVALSRGKTAEKCRLPLIKKRKKWSLYQLSALLKQN